MCVHTLLQTHEPFGASSCQTSVFKLLPIVLAIWLYYYKYKLSLTCLLYKSLSPTFPKKSNWEYFLLTSHCIFSDSCKFHVVLHWLCLKFDVKLIAFFLKVVWVWFLCNLAGHIGLPHLLLLLPVLLLLCVCETKMMGGWDRICFFLFFNPILWNYQISRL